jgi:hypothetical protein
VGLQGLGQGVDVEAFGCGRGDDFLTTGVVWLQ